MSPGSLGFREEGFDQHLGVDPLHSLHASVEDIHLSSQLVGSRSRRSILDAAADGRGQVARVGDVTA